MSIPLTNAAGEGLFDRIGQIGNVLYQVNFTQDSTEESINELLGRYLPPDEDLTATTALSRNPTVRSLSGVLLGSLAGVAATTLNRMVLYDQPFRATGTQAEMLELLRQMEASGDTVTACAVSVTTDDYATNTGNGILLSTEKRGDGRNQENMIAEDAIIECTTDSRTGGVSAGSEVFTFTGSPNASGIFDWDWPQGSGATVSFSACIATVSYPSGGNKLANSGFDSWNGTTNPLLWVKTGTLSKETSVVYGSGAASVLVTAGDTPTLTQQLDSSTGSTWEPSPLQSLGICLFMRGSATLSGGVVTVGYWDGSAWVDDATGSDAKVEFALTGLGTTWTAFTGVIRTPEIMPSTVYLRVAVTTTPSGGNVYLDHMAANTLSSPYAGGPGFAVFAGSTAFLVGDGWDVTTTNDRGDSRYGATFQTLFNRLFTMTNLGVGGSSLLLPSSATPTIPDSLITSLEGYSVIATDDYTRPANTTAYAANDAVADSTSAPTALEFADMGRVMGGTGMITKARLFTDQSTCTVRFRLHLFKSAPTPINDNSPYTLLYANRAIRIGEITFPAASTSGSGSDAARSLAVSGTMNSNLPMEYECDAADTSLYGLLEVLDAFTPASGQKVFIELTGRQD